MATIKAVKTITLTGSLSTFKVVSAPPAFGLQSEKIDVTDLTNATRKEFVARPQLEETDMNLQLDYAGTLVTAGGAAAVLTITAVDTAGNSYAKSITGFVTSAVPVVVDIGGERRMLQDVVFSPDGSNV
jgi:hypothetical protein